MPTTDQYAVFGHPIGHSKSPAIHRAFADATQQRLTYRAIEAPLEGFTDALHAFRREGGCGCNVTVPFKGDACSAADWLDPDAALAGALAAILQQCAGVGRPVQLPAWGSDVGKAVRVEEVGSAEAGSAVLAAIDAFKGRGGCVLLV